jgi:uncharacterized protein YdiU (UPF0061 family)
MYLDIHYGRWHWHHSYLLSLDSCFYHKQLPHCVSSPELICFNDELAALLALPLRKDITDEQWAKWLSGNELPPASDPIALAYSGHQFGVFRHLGDGRALLLGEHIPVSGPLAGKSIDIQLKGSGPTPYSRTGDGRAAIGPMLREYIMSEAMHGLNIPTTRSLAVVKTGDFVMRERLLPGAILTRIAQSHVRFGTMEMAASLYPTHGIKPLESLVNYVIKRHDPEVVEQDIEYSYHHYRHWFKRLVKRYVTLIAKWQSVGFIHGVMNSDNMSIIGETIDYGPCAFLDIYDPEQVFSSIDQQGRYRFSQQPMCALWNIQRLVDALAPLFIDGANELSQRIKHGQSWAYELLDCFIEDINQQLMDLWLQKFGFLADERNQQSRLFVEETLAWLYEHKEDYSYFFFLLTEHQRTKIQIADHYHHASWYHQWQQWMNQGDPSRINQRIEQMQQVNPCVVPRNWVIEEALYLAEQGDMQLFDALLKRLQHPYDWPIRQENDPLIQPNDLSMPKYRTFCGT